MVIRSEEEGSAQVIILSVVMVSFLLFLKSINNPITFTLAFVGAFALFIVVSRLFRYLQGRYFGEVIASVTEIRLEVRNKKVSWQQVSRWNITKESIWGLSIFHLILNSLTGYYSRTIYISTENKNLIVRNAPKRLQKYFEKYAPNAYDEKFIISEPKNKVT